MTATSGGKVQSKRTSRGVPVKKTQGVKAGTRGQTWVLVADRHRICLFEKTKDALGTAIELRESWLNPDGKKKARELGADRPGRSFDSQDRTSGGQKGGARHSYGSAVDPTDQVAERLVKQAVRLVGKATKGQKVSRLLVVAGPTLWGLLRPQFKKELPKLPLSLHEKDFAWLTETKVKERLVAYFL